MRKNSTIIQENDRIFLDEQRDKIDMYTSIMDYSVDNTSNIKNYSKILEFVQKLSIKGIIATSFIILIGIIIIMGSRTYSQASNALMSSYEDTMKNTLTMSTQAIELGIDMVKINCADLYSDKLIIDYGDIKNKNDSFLLNNIYDEIKELIVGKQVSNPFVKDIFLISPDNTYAPMTVGHQKVLNSDIYTKVKNEIEEMSSGDIRRKQMISRHSVLESLIEGYTNTSVGSVVSLGYDRKTLIIIDINENGIKDNLLKMQLEPEISVSYISNDNIEIKSKDDVEYSFVGKSYTREAQESTQLIGSSYVENGDYLFIYSKLEDNRGMVCVNIPKSIVINKVSEIKRETINLIIVACVFVSIVGLIITAAINIVTKDMIIQLKKVEKGDLTIKLNTSSKNEFGKLSIYIQGVIDSLYKLIVQTKEIIEDVNLISKDISKSAEEVEQAINDINLSVEEINQGGEEQAQETTSSLMKMDSLSAKMIRVQNSVEHMQAASNITNELIDKSVEALENVTVHSKNTIDVTAQVKEKIEHLSQESEKIKLFTSNIRSIAEQTTILSLNASIEAARVGQYGKGFNVVAEEVKKLANISLNSSHEVEETVKSILEMTYDTVEAVVEAKDYVQKQDGIIEETKLVFNNMSVKINGLLEDIHKVSQEINFMSGDRARTLQSLETITSVSEEIAASTAVVANNVSEQKHQSEVLRQVTDNLTKGMEKLTDSISVFKID